MIDILVQLINLSQEINYYQRFGVDNYLYMRYVTNTFQIAKKMWQGTLLIDVIGRIKS